MLTYKKFFIFFIQLIFGLTPVAKSFYAFIYFLSQNDILSRPVTVNVSLPGCKVIMDLYMENVKLATEWQFLCV